MCSVTDVLVSGTLGEAELGDRDDHEIELHFGRTHRHLLEDVESPVADATSLVHECLLESVRGLVGTELDYLPGREVAQGELPWVLTAECLRESSQPLAPLTPREFLDEVSERSTCIAERYPSVHDSRSFLVPFRHFAG